MKHVIENDLLLRPNSERQASTKKFMIVATKAFRALLLGLWSARSSSWRCITKDCLQTQFQCASPGTGGGVCPVVSGVGSELYQSMLRVKYMTAVTIRKLAIAPISSALSSSRNSR
jgi:hypothetical protein